MIDTHAHLDDKRYNQDRSQMIERAFNNGVSHIITVGADLKTSKAAIVLAQEHDRIYATVGIHPHEASQRVVEMRLIASLQELAKQPKVVAIGETGLELIKNSKCKIQNCNSKLKIKKQREIFVLQANLARELKLPLVIHCRNAHNQMIELLTATKPAKAVVHCFSGSWKQAQKYLDLGCYISFTGIITYARDYDKVIKNMPLDRMMAETDCPYLAPEPYRGQRNEPLYVRYVYETIAKARGENLQKIEQALDKNAIDFFNLK